ncbi:TEA domain-containing protein [Favolaschia claudopus]|uniref:TEA domain-containing protein n=1 Tax=Favolaschia claudopus TaxID=2862362 RepID=A0AAV9ZKF3_9AGAR
MALYYDVSTISEPASSLSSLPPTPPGDPLSTRITRHVWPSVHSHSINDALQSVLGVRKSWKTMRSGETVWPPDLEAALIEGLGNYQPDDSLETRMLGRFPRRNRFISDYILQTTGRRRTAKQVGSRLQQLRETCDGKGLLHLLSPFRQPAYSDSSASSDSSRTSPESPLTPGQRFTAHTVVFIDILPKTLPSPDVEDFSSAGPMWLEADDGLHVSGRPRCLRSINPTVTFISRCDSVIAESRFTVFFAGDRIVHKETTLLAPVIDVSVDGCLYSTLLVPEYWETISDSLDPTQFTIYQEIARIDNSTIVFSATYKFSYPRSRHSPIFPPAAIDTPCAPNTRPDIDTLPFAASLDQNQLRGPEWSPTLQSREGSFTMEHRSPSGDCLKCFALAL